MPVIGYVLLGLVASVLAIAGGSLRKERSGGHRRAHREGK